MNTMVFTRGEGVNAEVHTISLKNRKVLIELEKKYRLGYNGTDVWVHPNRDSFPSKSPRFFHNLHFYFAAIPFLFTDPGVTIKDQGKIQIDSLEYYLLNVSYDENIGDAPEDQYNMYINPATNQIDFITYSVTYFDKSKATEWKALKYTWQEANGLLAPLKYVGYKWENNTFGDKRYESVFSNVSYSKSEREDLFFKIPEGAEVTNE